MTTADQILWLLCQQARTRHELQAATGFSLPKIESALARLRHRQQIESRQLEPVRGGIGTRPGIMGRPKRPAVVYGLTSAPLRYSRIEA